MSVIIRELCADLRVAFLPCAHDVELARQKGRISVNGTITESLNELVEAQYDVLICTRP